MNFKKERKTTSERRSKYVPLKKNKNKHHKKEENK